MLVYRKQKTNYNTQKCMLLNNIAYLSACLIFFVLFYICLFVFFKKTKITNQA